MLRPVTRVHKLRWRTTFSFILIGLLMGWQLLLPDVIYAHADLVRAEPSPNSVIDHAPDKVTIWFNQPIEPEFSEIQVIDAKGQRVDIGDVVLDGGVAATAGGGAFSPA